MANRIQLRRGTAAQWTAANPVLAQGEPGIETDSGKQKFGDGVSRWSVLAYASKGDRGPAGTADDTTMTEVAEDPASKFARALNATYVPSSGDSSLAGKKSFNGLGKLEFNDGFTPNYDTVLWIASKPRVNPTLNSQGLYIQHRVGGNLGGLVNDAGASELRISSGTNTGTGQSAHENSVVITGTGNDINFTTSVLANHLIPDGTTGHANIFSMITASQVAPLPTGFTTDLVCGIRIDNQIAGTKNYSVYAPDGDSVFGPIVAKDASVPSIRAQSIAGQTAPLFQALGAKPGSATLFRIDPNGTGGFGGLVGGATFYANNNNATGATVAAAFKAHPAQTAALTQWLNSGGVALSYVASNGEFRSVNSKFAVRNAADTANMFSVSAAGPKWDDVSIQQVTVGAAGGATALPAAPTKYLKVQDSTGATLVIPAYAAS